MPTPAAEKDRLLSSSTSRSITKIVNGSHKFMIKGYSLAKGMGVGNHVASDVFTVGGYRWVIYFYPDGKNPEDSTYVSVFIALASDDINDRVMLVLTLLDQSGKGNHRVLSQFDQSLKSWPYMSKHHGDMWGLGRFFRRDELETSDFLKDDCLKINCTVYIMVSTLERSRLHSIQVPESDIGIHFGMLLEHQDGSDVVFDVSGEKIHAHKLVLAARSSVFKDMFSEGMSDDENEVIVIDMEPKVFKAMIHFIYKDTLAEDDVFEVSSSPVASVSDTLAAKLLAAADIYNLDRLRLICESYLCKDISVDFVASILVLADCYHAMELKAVCLKFVTENLAAVMRSDGFKYLRDHCPSLQLEILKTIVSCEGESSSGGGKSQSHDGGETKERRVRQRT